MPNTRSRAGAYLWVLVLNVFHTSQFSNLFFNRENFPYWFFFLNHSVAVDTQDNLTHKNHVSCSDYTARTSPFFSKTLAIWNPVFTHYFFSFDSSKIFCKYTNVFSPREYWWKTLENSEELTFCEGLRHNSIWEGFMSFRSIIHPAELRVHWCESGRRM